MMYSIKKIQLWYIQKINYALFSIIRASMHGESLKFKDTANFC